MAPPARQENRGAALAQGRGAVLAQDGVPWWSPASGWSGQPASALPAGAVSERPSLPSASTLIIRINRKRHAWHIAGAE